MTSSLYGSVSVANMPHYWAALSRSCSMAAARLLLLTCVAHARAYYTLREGQHCGFGHYGSPTGSAQRLLVTHLMPSVADWNVAVPMPPICKDTQVTGVDTTVCDADVPPDVIMHDLTSARVHRKGQLKGFAAVNVTVYCVLPTYSLSGHSTTTPRQLDDSRSSEEVMSNELITNEVMSSEATSHETLYSGNGLTSIELMPKVVKPLISSSSSPAPPEDTSPQVELTTPPEDVAPSPKSFSQSEELPQEPLKVTIKITPSHKSKKKRKPKSNEVILPSVSNKEKSNEVTSYQTVATQHAPDPYNPAGPLPRHLDLYPQYRGPPPVPGPDPSQYVGAPPRYPHMPLAPTQEFAAPPVEQSALMAPVYDVLQRPHVVSPLFRPVRLLRPRVNIWHRHTPMVIFRHF